MFSSLSMLVFKIGSQITESQESTWGWGGEGGGEDGLSQLNGMRLYIFSK